MDKLRIARASNQIQFFSIRPEYKIEGNAHARNAYGSAAQDIVCAALGLYPIPINGNCGTCFDAEDIEGNFYEIKSVHKNGKLVIYDWRMEKEANAKVNVFYAILVHQVRYARTSDIMWNAFANSNLEIMVLPASLVHKLAKREKKRRIKITKKSPKNGYNREGYKDGYRNLGLRELKKWASISRKRVIDLYGMIFTVDCRSQLL